ncbi:MAG: type I-E CRISPR-associated protein Cas7/Cse4/CasC [Desulfatitalea sp.]|nr:type I-E CRISPR-associated protein Cas7/Cse4/CasC [Desulfatitalea sp.]
MNLIELHILQSFPVTCLNRDDLGAPKSAIFGGAQRARISSQSWKRAIRGLASEYDGNSFAGKRSRFIIQDLKDWFCKNELSEADGTRLATLLADALGKLDPSGKGDVKTLLYFSPLEVQNMAKSLLALEPAPLLEKFGALNPEDKDDRKELENAENKLSSMAAKAVKGAKGAVKDKADIAIFGRMVADDHSLMVEGAGLFSHALSTHAADNEIDFFSAVDDEKTGDTDRGAGHIGTLEFNCACYYRYVGLNLDLLADADHLAHLGGAEMGAIVKNFIKSAILAVPGARKNSMFGWSPPAFVLGLKRTGQPLSLVNAFETPVFSTDGYLQRSTEMLNDHWETLKTRFCLSGGMETEVRLPPCDLDEFIDRLHRQGDRT